MTYIIGEIGQNHNGSVELAKVIIDLISREIKDNTFGTVLRPMDAVKLTKRDLNQELSSSHMKSLYNTPNSFGKTYGEHREYLELSDEEHHEVYIHAKDKGLEFVETLCAIGCLSILKLFTPDKLKVASRDLTNLPLLAALAETKIPIIVSTGMAGDKELDDAIEVITSYHSNLSILHCVSQYPTEPKNVNLNTIPYLIDKYKDFKIGYSDHTIGISVPIAAIAMGAEIIEKHITLDRNMKGTDQIGSLGPDGVRRMVRDIRLIDMSKGTKSMFIVPDTTSAKRKLERSIATNKTLSKGHVISEKDIHLLSPGDGFKWADKNEVIGKELKSELLKNELIYSNNLK
jgi:3-deoxy-D-glycero-D-galacto-nononate 9-phosphate synthase